MKPLTIYSFVPQQFHAAFYYRVLLPVETARDLSLPVKAIIDTNDSRIDMEARVKAFSESDIFLMYQPNHEAALHNARMVQSYLPSKRDGEWKYPPSIVVDTDDNLFNVSPFNPAFRGLGIRDHEGNDMPLGHKIGAIAGGKRRVLWHDGPCNGDCEPNCRKGIDLAANRHHMQVYRDILELSDAITCTTPRVAETFAPEVKANRVQVFPNLVRFDHYEQVDLVQDPKKIKILWQGGSAHEEDWYPLRQALGEVTKKYPEVHWMIWGQLYHWATDLIPPDRYTFIKWAPYQEYKLRLAMIGHDINLAPLTDHRFNRCRSAIKFYEACVLKKAIPTLAQNTGPYADEIIDGETGLLFNDPREFVEKLSLLIENEKLRREIGQNGKDWVSQNRDAFKMVPRQIAFYERLREEQKTERPHMHESDWEAFVARVEAEEAKLQEQEPTDAAVQPV